MVNRESHPVDSITLNMGSPRTRAKALGTMPLSRNHRRAISQLEVIETPTVRVDFQKVKFPKLVASRKASMIKLLVSPEPTCRNKSTLSNYYKPNKLNYADIGREVPSKYSFR